MTLKRIVIREPGIWTQIKAPWSKTTLERIKISFTELDLLWCCACSSCSLVPMAAGLCCMNKDCYWYYPIKGEPRQSVVLYGTLARYDRPGVKGNLVLTRID